MDNGQITPRGHDLEAEDVFPVWVANGRVALRAAELTGVPVRTVRDWVRRHDWPGQYRALKGEVGVTGLVEAQAELRVSLSTAYLSAVSIANDPDVDPRTRLQAIELCHKLAMGYESEGKQGQSLTLIDARQVHAVPSPASIEDPRSLRDKATHVIEANVEANRITRSPRKTFNG